MNEHNQDDQIEPLRDPELELVSDSDDLVEQSACSFDDADFEESLPASVLTNTVKMEATHEKNK